MNHKNRKYLGAVAAYLAAGLIMIYLSYSLPRLLPGDFVTSMYASSHVTLNLEQEAKLKAFYTQKGKLRPVSR